MAELVLEIDEGRVDMGDLALSEAASAKKAARWAQESLDEIEALARDGEMAGAWAELTRGLAGVALGHSHRAVQYAPGSPAAREARESAERAKGFARAAERATRRD